ncbi:MULTISPECIES: hypothetical protein [Microbulbifer]|uniref:hypothetical protein n=1 Tax=Microbulbifer TaxID=48073 RepID=UPI001E3F0191|nr:MULTISPECIES: hypothetical protein [Microbulbifer]UHQ56886.1 hypothetical protein LVE68_07895 [Microbulbifer sp. YPW16]
MKCRANGLRFAAVLLVSNSPVAMAQAGTDFLVWTFAKALLSVLVLLGLTFVALKAYVHWRGQGSSTGGNTAEIGLQERKRVSNSLTLYSISWKGKEYLVAEMGNNLTVVDKTEKDVEA